MIQEGRYFDSNLYRSSSTPEKWLMHFRSRCFLATYRRKASRPWHQGGSMHLVKATSFICLFFLAQVVTPLLARRCPISLDGQRGMIRPRLTLLVSKDAIVMQGWFKHGHCSNSLQQNLPIPMISRWMRNNSMVERVYYVNDDETCHELIVLVSMLSWGWSRPLIISVLQPRCEN